MVTDNSRKSMVVLPNALDKLYPGYTPKEIIKLLWTQAKQNALQGIPQTPIIGPQGIPSQSVLPQGIPCKSITQAGVYPAFSVQTCYPVLPEAAPVQRAVGMLALRSLIIDKLGKGAVDTAMGALSLLLAESGNDKLWTGGIPKRMATWQAKSV